LKRVDAPGATGSNLFTTGNPSLGIPATTVDDTIMNALQEEIVAVVLDDGQTLDQTNTNLTQLLTAINNKIGLGGTQQTFTIVNNTVTATNVTPLLFNSANIKSAVIEYDIHRQSDTASSELDEAGSMRLLYDAVAGNWRIALNSNFDDALVTFTVTAAGQVKYTSSDIAGSNSTGTMRMIIRTIKQ